MCDDVFWSPFLIINWTTLQYSCLLWNLLPNFNVVNKMYPTYGHVIKMSWRSKQCSCVYTIKAKLMHGTNQFVLMTFHPHYLQDRVCFWFFLVWVCLCASAHISQFTLMQKESWYGAPRQLHNTNLSIHFQSTHLV